MKRNVFRFVLTVLVFAILVVTSVSAATLTAKRAGSATDVLTFAREVHGPYTMPPDVLKAEYLSSVIRSVNKNFFLTLTFLDGAKFAEGSPAPQLEYLGPTVGVPPTITPLTAGPLTDKTSYEWHVVINEAPSDYPTYVIHFDDVIGPGGAGVKINAGTTVENGGTISAQVTVRDASTGESFDASAADVLFGGGYAISMREVIPDDAIIDVAADRKHFVDEPTVPFGFGPLDDDLNRDAGPYMYIQWDDKIYAADGLPFAKQGSPDKMFANWNTQKLKVTYASNLSEISVIHVNQGTAFQVTKALTDTDRAASSVSVEGSWYQLYDGSNFQIYVQNDGDRLTSRDLTVSIELLSGGVVENGHVLISNAPLTRWRTNGTILSMLWTNGNNAAMNGRVYLYNQSAVDGPIYARVVSLPRVGTGSTELAASVPVGILPGNGTAMIKVVEDILSAIPGFTVPYTTDGGNLFIEFTIQAPSASGIFQVFNNNFAYGTSELNRTN